MDLDRCLRFLKEILVILLLAVRFIRTFKNRRTTNRRSPRRM
ncbi:hypothetical protein ACOBQJ_03715 [Pelotomaculum propionicicum]